MKKILCGIICASAGAALAVQSEVTTIDVIKVESKLTNTVVAIPGLDLSGGTLAISNLVKTTNLTVNDKLIAFNNGNYECWNLNASKKWESVSGYMQDRFGRNIDVTASAAADKTMLTGQGIWLLRQSPVDGSDNAKPFYVYAKHDDSPATTVTAGTTALVGNPTTSNAVPSIANAAVNDIISIPNDGTRLNYQYNGSKWAYRGVGGSAPTITAGTGFWYTSKGASNVVVSW